MSEQQPATQRREPEEVLRRSWPQRIADRIFGFDFFVSYAWKDGRSYAMALVRKLEAEGFDCFLDSDDYSIGDDWKKIGAWSLRKTNRLVLVGTPAALESQPVQRELEIFTACGKRLIPVDIGGCLKDIPPAHPFRSFLADSILQLRESPERLTLGPSPEACDAIRRSFAGERQSEKRLRWIQRTAAVLAALLLAASLLGALAFQQRNRAVTLGKESSRQLSATSWLVAQNAQADAFGIPISSAIKAAHYLLRAASASQAGEESGLSQTAIAAARLAAVRLQFSLLHDDKILGAMPSDDGRLILTWSADRSARVWSADDGHPVTAPLTHEQPIAGAIMSPKADRVATWDAKGKVRLWTVGDEPSTDKLLQTVLPMIGAAFSNTGDLLLTWGGEVGAGGEVRLWSGSDGSALGEPLKQRLPIGNVVLAPNGQTLLASSHPLIQEESEAILWRSVKGQFQAYPLPHEDPVMGTCFSHAGDKLLTWSGKLALPKRAQLWDAVTGKPLGEPMLHAEAINGAAFVPLTTLRTNAPRTGSAPQPALIEQDLYILTWTSPFFGAGIAQGWSVVDGSKTGEPMTNRWSVSGAVFGGYGASTLTWGGDLTGGEARLWNGDNPVGKPLEHPRQVTAAFFTPDGHQVVTLCEDGAARLWRVVDGALLGQLFSHDTPIRGGFFLTGTLRMLVWGDDNVARVWEVGDPQAIHATMQHRLPVAGCAVSPDGGHFVSWGGEPAGGGEVYVWDAVDGHKTAGPIIHAHEAAGVAFSTDGLTAASWTSSLGATEGEVNLWQSRDGILQTKPIRAQASIAGAMFSPDSTRLLVSTGGNPQEKGEASLWITTSGSQAGASMKHTLPIRGACFSPDGQRIVTHASDEVGTGEWCLWNGTNGVPLVPMQTNNGPIAAVFFRGAQFLTCGGSEDKGTARWWRSIDGAPIGQPMSVAAPLTGACLSSDGHRLAAWNDEGGIWVWIGLDGSQPPSQLSNHSKIVGAVFTTNGNRLLTWGEDGMVRLWSVEPKPALLLAMPHPQRILGAVLGSHDALVLTWSLDGNARLWSLANGLCLRVFRQEGPIVAASMSRDAGRILTASTDGSVRLWHGIKLEPDFSLDEEILRFQIRSASALGANGQVRVLSTSELKAKQAQLAASKPQ